MAQEVQRSGKALQVLETWVATSQRLSVKCGRRGAGAGRLHMEDQLCSACTFRVL
jgi:hypothetical protein